MIITYVILAIVIIIALFLFEMKEERCKLKECEWEFILVIGPALSAMFALLVTLLSHIAVPTELKSEQIPLYSLADHTYMSSKSSDYNKCTYTFLVESDHGLQKEVVTLLPDEAYFDYIEKDTQPYVEVFSAYYRSGWWDFLVFIEGKFCLNEYYVFHIPEGSIAMEYKVDN